LDSSLHTITSNSKKALSTVMYQGVGFEKVTTWSVIKLVNHGTGYRLHSQEINYGTRHPSPLTSQ
jgi:hypothetical protein